MFGFVLALIAGFVTPYIDQPVTRPLARALEPHITLEPGEMRALSLLICLFVAALIVRIFFWGSVLWFVIGAIIGYFLLRIVAAAQKAIQNSGSKA